MTTPVDSGAVDISPEAVERIAEYYAGINGPRSQEVARTLRELSRSLTAAEKRIAKYEAVTDYRPEVEA